MPEEINIKKEPPAFVRWIALILISFAMFGNYYIYDSISPLADLLKEQLKYSDKNIGLLNAIYSLPNIIMVLIGGIIIDRIGTRRSVFIFSFLVMLGAFVTVLYGSIYSMAAGRLVFGLGAESMIVAITTIVARWFKGKELSFAFGLNLTVARLGSFLALNSPSLAKPLYNYWQNPLWISLSAGVFAVVCIVFYYFMDVYASRKYKMRKEGSQDKIVLREIFSFDKSFWFITFLCVTFYSAMFPFQTFAIKFFQEAHGTTREVGGNLSSILTLAAMIFTPLFGLLSDKIGKRSLLMMLGSLVIIPVYLIMAYKVDIAAPLGFRGGTAFLSTNAGETWIKTTEGLPTMGIKVLYTNPIDDKLFAGTNKGVYTTSNFGLSWEQQSKGITASTIFGFANIGTNIFVATSGGVFLSTDNGINWKSESNVYSKTVIQEEQKSESSIFSKMSLSGTDVRTISNLGDKVYTGTSEGVFETGDMGKNWTLFNNGLENTDVYSLCGSVNRIYAGSEQGIFMLNKNDTIWKNINNSNSLTKIKSIFIKDTLIFAVAENSIIQAYENDFNWTVISQGIAASEIYTVFSDKDEIFAGTDEGIYKCKINMNQWQNASHEIGSSNVRTITKLSSGIYTGTSDALKIKLKFFDIDSEIPFYLIIPMALMGFAFSLIPAVMWPSVALVVKEAKLGTAYGLMTMIQNIGLALFNLLIGYTNDISAAGADNPSGYNTGMWIFSTLGFLGLFFAFMLRMSERKKPHGLEYGSIHKKKEKKTEKEKNE